MSGTSRRLRVTVQRFGPTGRVVYLTLGRRFTLALTLRGKWDHLDPEELLHHAAATYEARCGAGVIIISRGLADELIEQGLSEPVRLEMRRDLPGIYECVVHTVSAPGGASTPADGLSPVGTTGAGTPGRREPSMTIHGMRTTPTSRKGAPHD